MTRESRTSILPGLHVLVLVVLAASVCLNSSHAAEPRKVFHSFTFGGAGIPESPDVEVLNYQYGNSKITRPEDWELLKGHIGQGTGVSGVMPVGEFLYVKWRILSNQRIYEDKVDLKSRLPSDMKDKLVHFLIKGPQLFVYLIEGNDSTKLHAKGQPDCPAWTSRMFKCTELYPEHWTNF